MIKKRNNKGQNVFTSFLNLLGVKHTESFSNKHFREHPHKYNLFGLSKMLSDYGVANKSFKTENKEEAIKALDAPFIAHTGGDFVAVYQITADKVHYLWQGKSVTTTLDEFVQTWTGAILLAEAGGNSIEPNYKENRKKEWLQILKKLGIISAIGLLAGLFFVHNRVYENIDRLLTLLITLSGLYVTYLLMQKQLYIHSEYSDKICSLFKQSDCNNVLESKAAKLGGVISWSEIGFGYFISNAIVILLLPNLFVYLVIINIFTLPYAFWSIWYQKFKAKQWCPLCLIVLVQLWAIFAINLLFGLIQMPTFEVFEILLVGAIYFIPSVAANLLAPLISQAQKTEQITQEFNALKIDEDVFDAFLKKQTRYEVDKSTSKILFGNPESDILITILTNPHCAPCSTMHTRVEKLLQDMNNSIAIQYILSSFNEEFESSARFLTAAYLTYPIEKVKVIYNEWFQEGKYKREEFFSKYACTQDEQTEAEFLQHKKWKEASQLRATPTVLVNGYAFPMNYKIEDLKYFTEIK